MLKPTFVDNQQQQQLKQPSSNYKRSNSSNVTKVVEEEEAEKAHVGFGLSHELKQHQQQHASASSTVATTTPTTIGDGRNSNIGLYIDSNNDMERINNATIEFVTIAIRNTVGIDINNETQHNNEHIGVPFPPTELYNISHHYFDGKVFLVGGEFLHFRRSNVDVQTTTTTMQQRSPPSSQSVAEKMKYLGRKLASNRPIKMVWLGGSNTEGRSPNPFVKQVHDMVHSQYPVYTYHTNISSLSSSSSSSSIQHTLINKGMGGKTSCSFAKGFKSEFYYLDVKNTDIVMLELAINDADHVLTEDENLKCFESLLRRIWSVSPNTNIVSLCIKNNTRHNPVLDYYNIPQIYLGAIATKLPHAIQGDPIHLNDIGSFLVCQSMRVFLQEAIYQYNSNLQLPSDIATAATVGGDDDYDHEHHKILFGDDYNKTRRSSLPPRLFEPTESYDWILNFNNRGKGWVIHNMKELLRICAPHTVSQSMLSVRYGDKLQQTLNSSSPMPEAHHRRHVGDKGTCSSSILAGMKQPNVMSDERAMNVVIPCEGCPNTTHDGVEDVGGGWTACGSPWAAVCKPKGVHHHHCSSTPLNTTYDDSGVVGGSFTQTFQIDNRPTDDFPAHQPREVNLVMRLLKGYDDDFGQSLVIAWIHESVAYNSSGKPSVATRFIDTKWEAHATVLDDVQITPSFHLPSPNKHETITLTITIVPIDMQQGNMSRSHQNEITTASTAAAPRRCRLYFHSVLGEFV